MEALKVQIVGAKERGREYEHRAKMFSYGEFNKMDQEKMLEVRRTHNLNPQNVSDSRADSERVGGSTVTVNWGKI